MVDSASSFGKLSLSAVLCLEQLVVFQRRQPLQFANVEFLPVLGQVAGSATPLDWFSKLYRVPSPQKKVTISPWVSCFPDFRMFKLLFRPMHHVGD